MYMWSSRDKLCPMRMVWFQRNYNAPEYEMHRIYYARPPLKRFSRRLKATTKVDKYYNRSINPDRNFRRKKKMR